MRVLSLLRTLVMVSLLLIEPVLGTGPANLLIVDAMHLMFASPTTLFYISYTLGTIACFLVGVG